MTGPRVSIIKQNASITITRSQLHGQPPTFAAKCRRHGVRQVISHTQAYTVEDSIAFCPACLKEEQAIMQEERKEVRT